MSSKPFMRFMYSSYSPSSSYWFRNCGLGVYFIRFWEDEDGFKALDLISLTECRCRCRCLRPCFLEGLRSLLLCILVGCSWCSSLWEGKLSFGTSGRDVASISISNVSRVSLFGVGVGEDSNVESSSSLSSSVEKSCLLVLVVVVVIVGGSCSHSLGINFLDDPNFFLDGIPNRPPRLESCSRSSSSSSSCEIAAAAAALASFAFCAIDFLFSRTRESCRKSWICPPIVFRRVV